VIHQPPAVGADYWPVFEEEVEDYRTRSYYEWDWDLCQELKRRHIPLRILEVGKAYTRDGKPDGGYEILAEDERGDQSWYDCYWSYQHARWCYGLDDSPALRR
jgi:hypothetical protein